LNARPGRNRQLGESKIKPILVLLVLAFAAYSAFKIVPAYFANYQLQDMIKSEALFATSAYPRKTADDIHSDVWKKVQELGIPAKPEAIKVTGGDQAVSITVDYTVPVDLTVYQFTLDFHPHADSHSI
jgi:hypothetical protein